MRSRDAYPSVLSVGFCLLSTVLLAHTAFAAAQTEGQQQCINTLNKNAAKVSSLQGKENSGCVKAASKGTASATCTIDDAKGKVGSAVSKALLDEVKYDCGLTNYPEFGYSEAYSAHKARSYSRYAYMGSYGTHLTTPISSDEAIGGCQSAVTKGLGKVSSMRWKEYVACKKAALAGGASDVSALQNCVTPGGIASDAKEKVSKAIAKLDNAIVKECVGVNVSSAFPGDCSSATAETLATCLQQYTACALCLTLVEIDAMGTEAHCDLFDDGLANDSCPEAMPDVCCELVGGRCEAGPEVSIFSCMKFGVPVGNGAVCDSSGSCVAAPGTPGPCCQTESSCVSPLPQTHCEAVFGGTYFPSATCALSGLCE